MRSRVCSKQAPTKFRRAVLLLGSIAAARTSAGMARAVAAHGRSGRASALYSLARGGRLAIQRFEASEVGGFEAQLGDEIGALAVRDRR